MRTSAATAAALGLAFTFTALASRSLACDKHEAAAKHTASDCCAKKTAKAASPASADDYVVPTATRGLASSEAGHGCPMLQAKLAAAKLAAEPSKVDCPFHKAAATTAAVSTGSVKQTGKVVCARCELKQSETCRTVFQATGDSAFLPLCSGGMSEELMKLTRHGELEVTIQGHIQPSDGARGAQLCIDGFAVGSI